MAASSSAPRRPLLPAVNKPKNRNRRRAWPECLTKQIRVLVLFAIAISSIAIFKIGLPHTSHSRTAASLLQISLSGSGASPSSRRNATEGHEAVVDVKMSELYEEIEFRDLDGGAWKQGWEVKYRGDEWDKQKLRVFVVPHSHNDPGWLRTVEEYYQERSRSILSTIVASLSKDKRRKFIWEEMSYLERWWRDASHSEKASFVELVKNGQLEIVGGGWVMNDEANSHYYAIIEQITEGNLWLLNTVGVIPKNAWAIDPFGHSPTMAYLLKRMGFENMLIQRTHYEVKKALAQKQNLEFFWRQSWDLYNTTDIFCHMMPFYSYDIPHTCGPEPAICCQFDYWRLPGYGSAQRCPWGYDPQRITLDNVNERSEKLLDQYRKKSTLYKTNTLLVPLGDDFRYITQGEADVQFENYQKIFDHINTHPQFKAEVQFGTLENYFTAAKAEMDARIISQFPSLSGDFFTYADRVQDYWSGYYVSRPFYKSVDRVLEETLRAADILFSLSLAYFEGSDQSAFPLVFSPKLISARRNLALFQHHDGITGTAKNHVVLDYSARMHSALLDLQTFMAQAVGALLGKRSATAQSADLDMFVHEIDRKAPDVLPVRKLVDVSSDQVQRIVIYNPLEEVRDQIVMVLVETTDVCVVDSNWDPVESQASPEWVVSNDENAKHRLHWQASIPPLGFQTFFISPAKKFPSRKPAELARVKVFNLPSTFSCPSPYVCEKPDEKTITIHNHHQSLVFSAEHGQLLQLRNLEDGTSLAVKEDIAIYSSYGSGAYLFKPVGEAKSIIQSGGPIIVTTGPLMQEVYTQPKSDWNPSPCSRRARVYNGKDSIQAFSVEMEYHVELLGHQYNDKELIVRYETDLETGNRFFSDLNGFQIIARQTLEKIPLQGNYYPMPSLAFIQGGNGHRFSVHSHQALGVASLKTGALEVMLDRRLTRDDERGLGQGVLDNRPMDIHFHLLFETSNTALPATKASSLHLPSLLSHRALMQLSYPVHKFLGKVENALDAKSSLLRKTFSPLALEFPCDLHIVSLKVPEPLEFFRSTAPEKYALTIHRQGWDVSYFKKDRLLCSKGNHDGGSLDLSELFKNLYVKNAKVSSLNLAHDISNGELGSEESLGRKQRAGFGGKKTMISLSAMEIQSLRLELINGKNLY